MNGKSLGFTLDTLLMRSKKLMTKLKSAQGAECLLGENPSAEVIKILRARLMEYYGITREDVARYAPDPSLPPTEENKKETGVIE